MAPLTGNSPGAQSRARGRPKGSGIDDAAELASVRAMLAADRKLKPTTAIKRLGIDDPSVIRRLRNKLAEAVDAAVVGPALPSQTVLTRSTRPPAEKPIPAQSVAPPEAPSPADAAAREQALLKAYLEALRASPAVASSTPPQNVVTPPPGQSVPDRDRSSDRQPPAEPAAAPAAAAAATPPPQSSPFGGFPSFPPMPGMMPGLAGAFPSLPGMPPMPGFPPFGGLPGMGGGAPPFSIPGFPSFMQPLQQKAAPPQPGTDTYRQLEAFKLAIEAMTAIARFQLHLVQNVAAYSPMALMLQGQAFMGQMLMASLTGQMDAARRMTAPLPSRAGG